MAQPSFSVPTRFVDRHPHVVEEHLVEVGVLGVDDLGQRPHRDARRVHRHQHDRDALVLRRVGIGAAEQEAEVGVVGARGPHLLAVDHPLVAVAHGTGGQGRQVAARAGLAHPEARGDLAAQDRQGVVADLVLGAVVEDRRRHDAEALHVGGAGHLRLGQLLDEHERLDRSGVAAAALGRPARHEPAGVEHRAGPAARPRRARGRWTPTGRRPSPRASAGWRRATRAARPGTPRPTSS